MVWMNRTLLWRTIRRGRQEMSEIGSLLLWMDGTGVGKKRKMLDDVDKSKDSRKKRKKNHTCDKFDESKNVERIKNESVQGSLSKKEKKKAKHMKKKKEREAAMTTTKIVLQLESTGKYAKSWFLQNKPMLHDLVVSFYWGPTWLNDLLQWFIHGCWPEKSKGKENKAFKKRFNWRGFEEQLINDMKSIWPQPRKRFLADEWKKHCRGTNMKPEEFFSTAMDICQAIRNLGIDLPTGIPMHAHEALSLVEDSLGKAHMSAYKGKNSPNEDILYITELKILIDRNSYAIGSRPNKLSYLGDIKDGDEMVILAENPVRLEKKKLEG